MYLLEINDNLLYDPFYGRVIFGFNRFEGSQIMETATMKTNDWKEASFALLAMQWDFKKYLIKLLTFFLLPCKVAQAKVARVM